MNHQPDQPVACVLCGVPFGPQVEAHPHQQGPYTLHLCGTCLKRHRTVAMRRQPFRAERDIDRTEPGQESY